VAQNRQGESVLDFLVEFGPLPPGAYTGCFFGLMESLESLFGQRVDLAVPSAVRNPYFLEAVAQTKTLVYAA
jgi:predicted nucleotidyltransferase